MVPAENSVIDHDFALDIINRLEFFNRFSQRQKHDLAHYYKHIFVYKENDKIITEGEEEHSFYILLSGKVSVTKGEEKRLITELQPGEFFGEISFLTKSKRSANVTASEKSIVIKVSDRILKSMDSEFREIIKDKIIEKLIVRLNCMNNLFVSHAH